MDIFWNIVMTIFLISGFWVTVTSGVVTFGLLIALFKEILKKFKSRNDN